MLTSGVIDVVIGLAFIFLLYSLLATTVSELMAVVLNWRAQMLYQGIKTMLTNTDPKVKSWLSVVMGTGSLLLKNTKGFFTRFHRDLEYPDLLLHQKFYKHPLIKNYGESKLYQRPSYIPPANFPAVLLDVLNTEVCIYLRPAAIARLQRTTPAVLPAGDLKFDKLSDKEQLLVTDEVALMRSRIPVVTLLLDLFENSIENKIDTTEVVDGSEIKEGIFLQHETAKILHQLLEKAAADANTALQQTYSAQLAQAGATGVVPAITDQQLTTETLRLFSQALETWFNDQMRRVSGWYKRQTQWVLMVLGFTMAVFFNIDTISIANRLSVDKEARTQLVNLAVAYTEKNKTLPAVPQGDMSADAATAQKTQDSLVEFSRKLLQEDIGKANNLLSIGYNGFGEGETDFRKKLETDSVYAQLVADSARAELQRLSAQNSTTARLLAIYKQAHALAVAGDTASLHRWFKTNEDTCAVLVNKITLIDSMKVAVCRLKDPLTKEAQCNVDMHLAMRDSLASIYKFSYWQWQNALRFGLADRLPALLKENKKAEANVLVFRYKTFTDSLSNALDIARLTADSRARDYGFKQLYKTHNVAIRVYYVWLLLCSKRLIGFLLTAFAVSLGAPFWFDLLNKFVNIRGAVKEKG